MNNDFIRKFFHFCQTLALCRAVGFDAATELVVLRRLIWHARTFGKTTLKSKNDKIIIN